MPSVSASRPRREKALLVVPGVQRKLGIDSIGQLLGDADAHLDNTAGAPPGWPTQSVRGEGWGSGTHIHTLVQTERPTLSLTKLH